MALNPKLIAAALTPDAPELGRPNLTVGQIVERLQKVAPNAAATSERIKHWTTEGLLFPAEQDHAGTGKHRRYHPMTVYDAAVLCILADAGLRMSGQRHLVTALSLARQARESWSAANTATKFLEISHLKNRGWTFAVHENAVAPDLTAEFSIVINLTRIFLNVDASEATAAPTGR